jgi:tetratricopeptide (TPR) repeat protein
MDKSTTNTLTHRISSFWPKAILIFLASVLLNINTLKNTHALDDEMVINRNVYMHMGFSGIKTILTNDSYQGFLDDMGAKNPLSGGRYRPLSIVSFAIEEELFSKPLGREYWDAKNKFILLQSTAISQQELEDAANEVKRLNKEIVKNTLAMAPIRHGFQIFYFAISMVILFWFLNNYLLPNHKNVAFIATLLFAFHPIHTEVIANLKSRDEIFSLIFILLSCISAFKYFENKSLKNLGILIVFSLGALLSKEYAVLLPVIILLAIVLVKKISIAETIKTPGFISLSGLVAVFLMFRSQVVGQGSKSAITDVLNDPFMYASGSEKMATKIALLNQYLKLLIFPHPLSADYSYNNFPYHSFTDWQVWLSILVWGSLIYLTYKLWQKKHIMAFAALFFFAFFMLINNMLFDIGATMGERLIYHSSLGFCLGVAWLLIYGVNNIKTSEPVKNFYLVGSVTIILFLHGYKTIARNLDWRTNFSLFAKDVQSVPNSALANGNAGSEYYNKGYQKLKSITNPTHNDTLDFYRTTDTSIMYLSKAVSIHQRFVSASINLGLCYSKRGIMDSAIFYWKKAASNFGGRNESLIENAKIVLAHGRKLGSIKDYKNAAKVLRDAAIIDPGNFDIWDNLGGSEYMAGNFEGAVYAFSQAMNLNPNVQGPKQGLMVAKNFLELQNKCKQDPLNPQVWLNAANAFRNANFIDLSEQYFTKANNITTKK